MIKRFLIFFFCCIPVLAQRTPLKVNGHVVDNPNFTNTATITWTVIGANVSGTASGGGGGGDTIWTNNAGVIQNIAGVSIVFTNGIGDNFEVSPTTFILRPNGNDTASLLPNVTDGTTPYVLDTSVAHTTGNLLTVGNMGTNRIDIDPYGQITSGGTIQDEYGDNEYEVLRALHIISLGDPEETDMFVEVANNTNFDKDVWIDINTQMVGPAVNALVDLHANNSTNGNATIILNAVSQDAGNTLVRIAGLFGSVGFNMEPTVLDGTTPYSYDTLLSHAGGELVNFTNHGDTNKAAYVKWDGAFQTSIPPGGTNAVPFKVGEHIAGTFTLVTTNAILLNVNGVTYKIPTFGTLP